MIAQPRGLDLKSWADSVCLDLGALGIVGKVEGDNWQAWGAQLCNNIDTVANLPNPYGFEKWDEWAERLCSVL
jgi:hypothetical protein